MILVEHDMKQIVIFTLLFFYIFPSNINELGTAIIIPANEIFDKRKLVLKVKREEYPFLWIMDIVGKAFRFFIQYNSKKAAKAIQLFKRVVKLILKEKAYKILLVTNMKQL